MLEYGGNMKYVILIAIVIAAFIILFSEGYIGTAFIVLLSAGVIGLIIFLITRFSDSDKVESKCSKCGKQYWSQTGAGSLCYDCISELDKARYEEAGEKDAKKIKRRIKELQGTLGLELSETVGLQTFKKLDPSLRYSKQVKKVRDWIGHDYHFHQNGALFLKLPACSNARKINKKAKQCTEWYNNGGYFIVHVCDTKGLGLSEDDLKKNNFVLCGKDYIYYKGGVVYFDDL